MPRHEVTAEVVIAAPPQKVFRLATDTRRAPDWLPNVTKARDKGRSKGVGAERILHIQFGDHEVTSHQRIVEHEPGRSFAWLHIDDRVNGEPFNFLEEAGTKLFLRAKGKKTVVEATAHFRPKGFKANLAAPLYVSDVRRQMEESLAILKQLAESE